MVRGTKKAMKLPADSVLIAGANALLTGFVYFADWANINCCMVPELCAVLVLVVIPGVLVISLFFLARDFIRAGARKQAALALVLSVPALIMVMSLRF